MAACCACVRARTRSRPLHEKNFCFLVLCVALVQSVLFCKTDERVRRCNIACSLPMAAQVCSPLTFSSMTFNIIRHNSRCAIQKVISVLLAHRFQIIVFISKQNNAEIVQGFKEAKRSKNKSGSFFRPCLVYRFFLLLEC